MKKITLFALFFSIIFPLSFAHADSNTYAEAYAVGSNGSTTFQSAFTLNEQPFIYIKFYNTPPVGSLTNEMTFSTWVSPGGGSANTITTTSSSNQLWISFSPSVWNSIKSVGQWDTGEFSFNPTGGSIPFAEAASFTVNAAPEPASTVLFLTGALIMGFSIIRRKSVMAV